MTDRIALDPRWCIRPLGSTCERCRAVCPESAISFTEGGLPQIDDSKCSSCALCAGICDAFVCADILPLDILAHARSCKNRSGSVHFTCMEALSDGISEPAGNVIVLTCLAQLSPELWTAMLASDIPVVLACDEETCRACRKAGERGYALWRFALSKAIGITGATVAHDRTIPQKESLLRNLKQPDSSDRREIAEDLGATLQDLASGERRKRTSSVIDDYIAMQEQRHADAAAAASNGTDSLTEKLRSKSAYKTRVVPPRLELTEIAALADEECADRIQITVAEIDRASCGCADQICAKECPTHALRPSFAHSGIDYEPRACIGCGYCSAVCPNGAIALTQKTAKIFR